MKTTLLIGITVTLAAGLGTAAENPKQTLANAVQQLRERPNYSWTTSFREGDGSPGRLGPLEGKAEKSGLTFLSFAVGDVPVEVFMKGDKGCAKVFEQWQSFDELARTGSTPAAVVRFLRSYQTPAVQAADLAGKAKDLKTQPDGAVEGELTEDAVKELLVLGLRGREGQEPPKTADSKGSVKFWLKDGALTKYEIKLQGKVTVGERTMNINRTQTVELKAVGATTLALPPEAEQKLM
ncbi:MAG: hypothetical protein RMK20_07780 [Verrucomicrobiales bacterium]|nr:hypothetical protein [Verrucomicrobiales bacterium]